MCVSMETRIYQTVRYVKIVRAYDVLMYAH